MKNSMLSKILCLILSLAMLATMFALPVAASETEEETETLVDETETETEVAPPEDIPELPDGSDPSAPIPVPVPEEEDTSLNVIARTLALKDNVYIKYAVPVSENDVKMLFWLEAQEEYVYGTQAEEASSVYEFTINGTLCNIFQYTAMADHQMTDVIYARAYTVIDGEYVYGEVNKYSILQYAYNMRQAEEIDEELDSTLTELLDKGAEAQLENEYKVDDLANEPHSNVHVIGDTLADGFKDMLNPDSKEITDIYSYMLESGRKTFYIENNVVMTGYHTLESYIYYFEADNGAKKDVEYDGHMFDKKGRIYADCEFVTIAEGVTYYLVSSVIVYNYYVIENYVYYFGTDGVMRIDFTIDDYYFGVDGKLLADSLFFNIGDHVYYIVENVVIYIYIYIEDVLYLQIGDLLYPTTNYDSVIYESDNDENAENNDLLDGVTCIARIESLGIEFTVTSDALGNFSFAHLPMVEIVFVFIFEGYIETTIVIDMSAPEEYAPIILDRNVSNTLSGRVTIADTDTNFGNNASLEGATVTIDRVSSTNPFTATTVTDANGNYTFGELTAGVYKLVVIIEHYILVNQTVYIRYNETNIQNTPIEAIPGDVMTEGGAAGNIVDARTGYAVVGVTVYIRAGLNNVNGEIVAVVTTDANGRYEVTGLVPGNYTAQVVDERELDDETYRFGTLTIAIKVMAEVTIYNQNATVSNSAGLDLDGMRVVLTWGSTPSDLDSHMQIRLKNGSSAHVYYGSKKGLNTDLDVDDTTSYGPETMTVRSIADGVYTYYVYNFSSGGNSNNYALANSGATINIYFGGSASPAYTLHVPNVMGNYWNVFTYNSVTGEFTIVNTVTGSAVIP